MDEIEESGMREASPAASAKPGNSAFEEIWDKAQTVLILIGVAVATFGSLFVMCAAMHYLGLDPLASFLFRQEYFIFGYNSIYDLCSIFLGW